MLLEMLLEMLLVMLLVMLLAMTLEMFLVMFCRHRRLTITEQLIKRYSIDNCVCPGIFIGI